MISLTESIDLNSEDAEAFLSDIQGNILKGHGRQHTAHLLLLFKNNSVAVQEARLWLTNFADSSVTSAWKQLKDTELYKKKTESDPGYFGTLFAMLFLTAPGYKRLDISQIPNDRHNRFIEGMGYGRIRKDGDRLYDWESPYNGDLHAKVLLAHNDEAELQDQVSVIKSKLSTFCATIHEEWGHKLTQNFNGIEQPIEHFGYVDGISQPLFIKQETDQISTNIWNPADGLDLVLVKESNGTYGSFMVFRKLEQDVQGFNAALEEMATKLGIDKADAEAMIVGRRKDGTPLNMSGIDHNLNVQKAPPLPDQVQHGRLTHKLNNFNFKDDPHGAICPFHAHIRKSNPRGDLKDTEGLSLPKEKDLRIVRRGITYGYRPDLADNAPPDAEPPKSGVGLLFMSFQSELRNFEIQQIGSDSEDFPKGGTGIDPIIGRGPITIKQKWPSNSLNEFAMPSFVTLKGGVYCYAPSLTTLKGLSSSV